MISTGQSTVNDETHDTKPANMILKTADSVNFTSNITTKSFNIDRQNLFDKFILKFDFILEEL